MLLLLLFQHFFISFYFYRIKSKLNWIICHQYFFFSFDGSTVPIMACRQRLVKSLNIPIVLLDKFIENFRRVIGQQEFSFHVCQYFQITNKMFLFITTVVSLVCPNVWRVTVDESILSVPALDNFVGIILFDLCIAKPFH